MKRLLLAGLAVVCAGLAVATAQTINRSVQLSLDAGGMFPVSTPGGLFLPDRLHGNSQRTPTVASNGSATVVTGTDLAGEIVEGNGAITTAILTFTRVQNATPYCTAATSNLLTPVGVQSSPAGVTFTHSSNTKSAATTILTIYYTCISARIQ